MTPEQAAAEIQALYSLFLAVDATQVEINPLIETPQGQVVAVDAKIQVRTAGPERQARGCRWHLTLFLCCFDVNI